MRARSQGRAPKGPPRLADRADSFLAKHVAAGCSRFVLALNFLMPWGSFVAYLAPRDVAAPGTAAAGSPMGGDPRVKISYLAKGTNMRRYGHFVIGES